MKKFSLGILCCLNIFFSQPLLAQNVWTQHNDQSRTGWYPSETILNTSNVNPNTFGLNFTHSTDDKVVAQPLVVMKVSIPTKGIKNVVFVATLNNTIYAYDADADVPVYWQKNFTNKIAPSPAPTCSNCRPAFYTDIHPSLCFALYPDFDGNMGIVGTPVIDTTAGIMYFVSKIVNPGDGPIDNHTFISGQHDEYTYTTTGFHQYLHAIDITTGNDLPFSPVEITATAPGTGDGQIPANSHIIKFDPRRQFNRAGLALNNGKLYVAMAAHCDFNPCHGWVLSYNPSNLTQVNSFISTPNDGRGGIWMSGTAPAIDAAGNLYFTTGNSLNESPSTFFGEVNSYTTVPDGINLGESVVKLNPDLTVNNWFTPFHYLSLNDADKDFPIQVMLLPGTNMFLTGCKDDSLYVLDRNNMGHFNPVRNNVLQTTFVSHPSEMHSSFAYFGGPTPYAFQNSENSQLKAYQVIPGVGLGPAITNTAILKPVGGSGGYMSVSSNGPDPNTGILWVYQAKNPCDANSTSCPGVLHAVNASNITTELWSSEMNAAEDGLDIFNKMSCPTIALGKVYLAGDRNQLMVYGLKTSTNCVTNRAFGKPATASSGGNANNVTDGNLGTFWTSNGSNANNIFVDLQASFDICKIAINWNGTGIGSDFDVQISNDAVNWTAVSSFRGNTLSVSQVNGAFTARFVRMFGITKGPTAYSISEFQVFGNAAIACQAPGGITAASGNNTSIFTTQIPTASSGQDGPVELGVQFQSSVAGFITGVRFYETPGGNPGFTGTHIGELYRQSDGSRLAQATFTQESLNGWQTVNFSTPVAITAGTTYVAATYFESGWHLGDINGLAGPISNGTLTALAGGGVFNYGAGPVFPTQAFNNSNYWVDAIFTTNLNPNPLTELVSWNPVPGATQYTVNYRPSFSASYITRTTSSTSITLSPMACGSDYDFNVQTNCGGGLTSAISQGSFTVVSCPANSCDIFPVRFFNVDLGDIGVAGNTCKNANVYTLTGSGTDIGGTSDQFQFAFTNPNTADIDVFGQVIQQDLVNASNKLGIMIRDSMTITSRFAFVASVNNGSNIKFESRVTPGGTASVVNFTSPFPLPYWLKITKIGTTYAPFVSLDKITWIPVSSPVDLQFGTNPNNAPHVGMAITSVNNSSLSSGKIGDFSIVPTATLPVKLISFTAKNINNDHVLVSWATSMEHLSDHFEIQRSTDNNRFKLIDKVDAVGESESPRYYSVNDRNPVAGVNYYRLKEIDKDGKFYFSPVVSVNFDEEEEDVRIFPNPTDNFTTINSTRYAILEVNIYDVTGKLMQNIHLGSGQNTVRLNTADLSKGIYVVSIKTTKTMYRRKLFKQ